jgi:hypothetical protein
MLLFDKIATCTILYEVRSNLVLLVELVWWIDPKLVEYGSFREILPHQAHFGISLSHLHVTQVGRVQKKIVDSLMKKSFLVF